MVLASDVISPNCNAANKKTPPLGVLLFTTTGGDPARAGGGALTHVLTGSAIVVLGTSGRTMATASAPRAPRRSYRRSIGSTTRVTSIFGYGKGKSGPAAGRSLNQEKKKRAIATVDLRFSLAGLAFVCPAHAALDFHTKYNFPLACSVQR